MKIPIDELLKLKGIYNAKVQAQRHPDRLGRPVLVQFGNAEPGNWPDGFPGSGLAPWWRPT